MIDVDGIRDILKRCDIYVKENAKNFVCICPYCGDHKDKSKKGHCYVSKDDSVPVAHCWLCGGAWNIKRLLFDLTGENNDNLIVIDNNKKNYVKKNSTALKKFKIPELSINRFPLKCEYIQKRTFGKLDINKIPNMVFDIKLFFEINGLNIENYIEKFQIEYVQNNMVGFVSKRNTLMYFRAISNKVPLKFKKVVLQTNCLYKGLDYYSIDNVKGSNVVVLSEGNFDILGCYSLDSLNLNDKCLCYCSGCTFSYAQLLRSICVDYSVYRPNVVILSDSDKKKYNYTKFFKDVSYIVDSVDVYYNSLGKDFGEFHQKPVKLF